MCNTRIVLCEACQSEGRRYFASAISDEYGNEMRYEEPCDHCDGTGGEIIETQPIEMEDLDVMAGVS